VGKKLQIALDRPIDKTNAKGKHRITEFSIGITVLRALCRIHARPKLLVVPHKYGANPIGEQGVAKNQVIARNFEIGVLDSSDQYRFYSVSQLI
jgi:hypothetical protein